MTISRLIVALIAAFAISTAVACGDKDDTTDSGHEHSDSGHSEE